MANIPLFTNVEGLNGHLGQSTCVIVNPTSLSVTHLVVKATNPPFIEG